MSKSVAVESIHWVGPTGGAIFTGRAHNGLRIRVVADIAAMPRSPKPGEVWELQGALIHHPEYGSQFQANAASLSRPSGDLVIGFLSGGACPGIGKVKARQLYEHFGDRLYDLLDGGQVDMFYPIIGMEPAAAAIRAWAEQALEVSTYRWLDSHGLPKRLATALTAIYGNATPEKVADNPYRLMAFLPWRQVDALARSIGVPRLDARRLVAGVEAVIFAQLEDGHTATLTADLISGVRSILCCDAQIANDALRLAAADNAIVQFDDMTAGLGAATMETFIARQVTDRLVGQGQASFASILSKEEIEFEIDAFERRLGYTMAQEQRAGVSAAIRMPFSVLTGGAGTGKTTALRAVHDISERHAGAVHQIALAGRAAQRMVETTGRPAMTIAGFINKITKGTIGPNALSGALVIIDEASMLDLPLTYRLLKKLPTDARLLLVGDPGQLPPIGFGLVLHVLAEDWCPLPKSHLIAVHRQSASTGIPAVAKAIRSGEVPAFDDYIGASPGVNFIESDGRSIIDLLYQMRSDLGAEQTQIIAAQRVGTAGVGSINAMFHRAARQTSQRPAEFFPGEPVIWTQNDYELGLMNGSMGNIVSSDADGLIAIFDGVRKFIPMSSLGSVEHAYAITVHKAQGSQFDRVIMPIVSSRFLDRTMLYTGVTRAQQQVVLVGSRAAFAAALATEGISSRRQVGLRTILARECQRVGLTLPPNSM